VTDEFTGHAWRLAVHSNFIVVSLRQRKAIFFGDGILVDYAILGIFLAKRGFRRTIESSPSMRRKPPLLTL
jgi:hypothetical protein